MCLEHSTDRLKPKVGNCLNLKLLLSSSLKFIKTVCLKMAVFWIVVTYSLAEVYQCFWGACCLHHQGDELAKCEESIQGIGTSQTKLFPFFSLLSITKLHLSSALLSARLWSTLLQLVPLPLPNPYPLPHWAGQGSTLSNSLPCLKLIPHTWLPHCPDDWSNKHLWNPVNFYQTTCHNNPADNHLHTRHHENLKSHLSVCLLIQKSSDWLQRFT
jgi:hypothetical protein